MPKIIKGRFAVLSKINTNLKLIDLTIPELKKGQILAKLKYSFICGSQINEWLGRKGKDKYIPHTLGHEASGKIVGVGKAIELITTGKIINAEESYRIGLANKICPQNQLMSESRKLASSILQNGPRAISSSLRCIHDGLTMSIKEGMDIEVEEFGELFRHDERMEGLTAFIEKRDPEFRH